MGHPERIELTNDGLLLYTDHLWFTKLFLSFDEAQGRMNGHYPMRLELTHEGFLV